MKRTIAVAMLTAALGVGLAGCGSLSSSTGASSKPSTSGAEQPSQEPAGEETPAETPAEAPAEPEYTVSQQNAIESAESYLENGSFSEKGLLQQLTSEYGEGFPKADALFAIKHVKADWNAEAREAAQSYLDNGSFSRKSLIQQLTSKYGDQYTQAQALQAVKAVGL